MRPLTATIQSITGAPLDGVQVVFVTPGDEPDVVGVTDASGVLTVNLEPGMAYAVGIGSAVQVDGALFGAGAVIRFTVPSIGKGQEDGAPLTLADAELTIVAADLPTLLARIEALEAWRATVEGGQP